MPTPFCQELGRPWRIGDRVLVTAEKAPLCRSGEIRAISSGGALVLHDEPALNLEIFGSPSVFGWAWSELAPEPN